MDLGIEKCAMMLVKRGKLDKSEGIRLPSKMEILSEVLEMTLRVINI